VKELWALKPGRQFPSVDRQAFRLQDAADGAVTRFWPSMKFERRFPALSGKRFGFGTRVTAWSRVLGIDEARRPILQPSVAIRSARGTWPTMVRADRFLDLRARAAARE
jgi:hypothetical protein